MSRAAELSDVDEDTLSTVRALFPDAELSIGRGDPEAVNLRLVPHARRVHMLVPASSPGAAGRAIERPTAKDSLRQVSRRRAVAVVLRTPALSRLMMPDVLQVTGPRDSLLGHLSDVVGERVQFSVAIGSKRANRKPVLSVFTESDDDVGFAKVGLTPLANHLIDHEASVLRSFEASQPKSFRPPRLLYHGAWRGSRVLLMETLRPHRRQPSRTSPPLSAMVEICSRVPLTWQQTTSSAWWQAIEKDSAGLDESASAQHLANLEKFRARYGKVSLPMGYWHGDLGPWNMAWDGATPLVWDWERASAPVPAGLDALHYVCHPALRDVGNLSRARHALANTGTHTLQSLLDRLGMGPQRPDLRAVVATYLLTVATRFALDAGRPDGGEVRTLAEWYAAVLRDHLERGVS